MDRGVRPGRLLWPLRLPLLRFFHTLACPCGETDCPQSADWGQFSFILQQIGELGHKGVDVLELTVDGHKIRYALRAGTTRWCGKNLEEEGLAQT